MHYAGNDPRARRDFHLRFLWHNGKVFATIRLKTTIGATVAATVQVREVTARFKLLASTVANLPVDRWRVGTRP